MMVPAFIKYSIGQEFWFKINFRYAKVLFKSFIISLSYLRIISNHLFLLQVLLLTL